jgi:hypothetical protein
MTLEWKGVDDDLVQTLGPLRGGGVVEQAFHVGHALAMDWVLADEFDRRHRAGLFRRAPL